MPTKPGSCGLPYYGIEFAVLDPVVRTADTYIAKLPYHAYTLFRAMHLRLTDSVLFLI